MRERKRKRETEEQRDKERETEKQRETDRQTDRQTDRGRERSFSVRLLECKAITYFMIFKTYYDSKIPNLSTLALLFEDKE